MTRKDYKAVAEVFARIRKANKTRSNKYMVADRESTLQLVISGLCVVFHQDNPNFKADVFKAACEPKEDK